MSDRIEKTIDLQAPIDRVWAALTDPAQFGEWFRVKIETPFKVGEEAVGMMLYPGYEHLVWRVTIVTMEPKTLFAFTWRPYAVDPEVDYSAETPTLVQFRLAPLGEGVRLTVTESGFDKVPAHRRDEAFRSNEGGWAEQIQNVKAYVER